MENMSVISIASVKGGTGKTTTAVNLGASLAIKGYRVLLVDNDAQGSLTKALGFTPDKIKYTLLTLMNMAIESPDELKEVLDKTIIHYEKVGEGNDGLKVSLDLIPANKTLTRIITRLIALQTNRDLLAGTDEPSCEFVIREIIEEVKENYDYILIDCGPKADLQMVNALAAADEVIIPVRAHYLDSEGLPDTIDIIRRVKKAYNPTLTIRGILLTMFQSRTKLARIVRESLYDMYSKEVPIFSRPVDYSVRVAEPPVSGDTLFTYEPNAPAALAYDAIAEEVVNIG